MSMLCNIYRITPEQAEHLKRLPDAVGDLLGLEAPAPRRGFFSRLFGKPAAPPAAVSGKLEPVSAANTFELEQTWHILHFLLSGGNAEGPWPLAFLMSGGVEVGPDLGYGAARLFNPAHTREITAFLGSVSLQMLEAAYIPEAIEAAEIYWRPSTDTQEQRQQLDDLWRVLAELRAFYETASQAGNATLISIY
ncbi:MAG: YfbM family protein [Zoogloea sp.]|uniref:YfbM family protein n=1 Tax=Zoogloea sp. TaxID=49181 RepID=UPI00262D0733|nr:YfbM family protein [Zoogloea sp.]MDD2990458.1 YfbM family protein [Zoogloea sp.]